MGSVPSTLRRISEEEFGVCGDLEEAVVVGCGSDEECAGAGCSGGDRHAAIVKARTSGAKALPLDGAFVARVNPCP
jgi:hypothetical protein